jgi:hypothetical protein
MDEPKEAVGVRTVQQSASAASPSIDIEKLAQKVYQLMHAELRLARIRGNPQVKRR